MKLETSAPARAWTVVLRPGSHGIVDEVQGGAPITWLGHRLATHPEAPDAVRDAAVELEAGNKGQWVEHRRVHASVAAQDVPIDLIVCHAVPVRRANVVVRDMILRVLDLFRLQAPEFGVEIRLEYSEGVPVTFPADGEKITWAISTLIGNALRHLQKAPSSPRGPRISIIVDYELEPQELIIRVVDNGPGIPLDRRRWLFEQDPRTGRPTGLALIMVKDVIVAHGGTIEVESKPTTGMAITLRLPRVRD